MLNWIDKNERLPTEEDAGLGNLVYGLFAGIVKAYHWTNIAHAACSELTHWLPFREMPVPKRWRVPTIHDLAKAGKPIPCRVRDKAVWSEARLCAIDVDADGCTRPFLSTNGNWYKHCEICDE